MAKIINEISNKNIITLSKSFDRANGQPLDTTSVYPSFEAAKDYAESNKAYVGQIIVVVDSDQAIPYIITKESGDLQEVGSSNSSSSGTKTFESLQEAADNLAYLNKGQIVTVVNEDGADAYIVNYDSTALYPVAGSMPQEELSSADITDILNGTYDPTVVTSNNTVKVSQVSDILTGDLTYLPEDQWPANSIKMADIDTIIE